MELDKIYFGDCIKLMSYIPDKSIDLCVTDAPYLHNKSPLSPTYDGKDWNQTSIFGNSELYKYGLGRTEAENEDNECLYVLLRSASSILLQLG